MGRIERRAFRLRDQLDALRADEARLVAELEYHRGIHDDARRDAIVGNADDRAFFGEVKGDLPRFEKALTRTRSRIENLEERLRRLISSFDDQ